jgi:hypothetical protein
MTNAPADRQQRCRALAAASLTLTAIVLLGASGCAHPGYAYAEPEPRPAAPQVYFYPRQGQSPERQDRDRYECYRWAVRQSRFDPSGPQVAPPQRVQVVPTRPPVADTFTGAATGALIGSAVTWSGEGAAIGAAVGAVAGAISDIHREHGRRELERNLSSHAAPVASGRAHDYRRAMSACLEGRGYAVG